MVAIHWQNSSCSSSYMAGRTTIIIAQWYKSLHNYVTSTLSSKFYYMSEYTVLHDTTDTDVATLHGLLVLRKQHHNLVCSVSNNTINEVSYINVPPFFLMPTKLVVSVVCTGCSLLSLKAGDVPLSNALLLHPPHPLPESTPLLHRQVD